MTMFTENKSFIQAYVLQLKEEYGDSDKAVEKVAAIQKFLEFIVYDPGKYDQFSTINQGWSYNDFLDIFRNKKTDLKSIEQLFQLLSRVAREVTLRQPYVPAEPEKLFLDYYAYGKAGLNAKEIANSDFLWASFPKYVAMEHLQEIVAERVKTEKAINEWESSLKSWDEKVQQHELNLKKYHENYNFVGLSKAFNEMFRKKVIESRVALLAMVFVGIVILAPLSLPLFTAGQGAIAALLVGAMDASKFAQIASIFGLEFVLIYFFRIALHNWQSLRTQALQLDLRQSLCAFVEGYAKFAGENEKQAQNLSQFESLIFSRLISETGLLPSTYDGLDAIMKIIKEFRAK